MNNQLSNPTSSPVVSQSTITTLPGATAILRQAWLLYRHRLRTFLGVMIIPMLVLIIGVIAIINVDGLLKSTPLSSIFAAGGVVLLIILAVTFFMIVYISLTWGEIAMLYAIKDGQEGIGVAEAYRRSWHKMLSYLWVSILVQFITMGGFLLFVVPGIIFAVWFSLAKFILVAENLKGMNSLLKSREYVKGKWGSVFWRFSFIDILYLIVFLAVTIVLILLIPNREILLTPNREYVLYVARFIIGLFFTPLATAYRFLVYSNLKALKGEIAFAPTGGQKAKFIIVAFLGFLFIPAILFLSYLIIVISMR